MQRVREISARLRTLDPRVVDGLVAALAGALIVIATVRHSHGWPITLAGGAGIAAALYLRRRPRVILFAAPAACGLLGLVRVLGGRLDASDAAFISLIFLVYSLGSHVSGRRLVLGTLATGVTLAASVTAIPPGPRFEDFLYLSMFIVGPVLLGRTVRGRRNLAVALAERADRLEREHEAEALRAVEGERARIAEELHDVVAHSVSAMTVQAGAARRVARQDPAAAREALRAAEDTGRDALTEMRRLLGVLRSDQDGMDLAPQPGMARLESLAEEFRARGLSLAVEEVGDRPALTPGVDLAAYRILEDALRGAQRHAARSATVLVRYDASELELRIEDDGVDDLPGQRDVDADQAVGIGERAALYGGRVQTGRRDDGRFGTRIVLPTEPVLA